MLEPAKNLKNAAQKSRAALVQFQNLLKNQNFRNLQLPKTFQKTFHFYANMAEEHEK